jgi:hypothetical protein
MDHARNTAHLTTEELAGRTSENQRRQHSFLQLTVAAVLLRILSLLNLLGPLVHSEGLPALVVYLGISLGVADPAYKVRRELQNIVQ